MTSHSNIAMAPSATTKVAPGSGNELTSTELMPLSYAQQRLWFIDQLQPDTSLYNVPSALRLRGELNLDALSRSLNALVQRHEVLRTVYELVNGEPVQKILEEVSVEMPFVDLSHHLEAARDRELCRRMTEEASRPFDLSHDLMFRCGLFRLSALEHVLFLNIHHIACDEWSMGILYREFASLYESFRSGQKPCLRELPVQYADFALWQRECLNGATLGKQLEYWRKQLRGPLPVLELPADHSRPVEPTHRGERVRRVFSPVLSNGIRSLCLREGVTPFMLLLAAFKVLLHRYTSQEDIVVGTPIAGRTRVETEGLIGFFVNTLALRSSISDADTFQGYLHRLRETTLGAFSNQDLPFEKLVEELQPDRNAQNPFFNVMFAVQNAPAEIAIPGLSVTPFEVDNGTAKFDLTMVVHDGRNEMVAELEYSVDLFEAHTAARLLTHLERLLEGIIATPDAPIAKLPLLTDHERLRIVDEWNSTATSYPAMTPIHTLFQNQAERTPDAVAAVYGDEEISYRDLDERSNQLANHLRKFRVGPDVLVGICVERSIEMIVGWLGILKAGGAYVPLDPGYPADRLEFMLEDTKMPVLLTEKKLLPRLPKDAKKICLDADWKVVARESKSAPTVDVTSGNLAYVIYTSGSTGKPKGVAVPHRAIARLVFNTNYIQLGARERIAQASNSSFDAATFEVWGALLHGGKLVGVTQNTLLSPREFAVHLRKHDITTLFLTTALFNQIAADVPDAFHTLKHVLFGGEACDPKSVKQILVHGPPQRLLHVYGPTETTTFASWFHVKDVPIGATTLPIGQPLSNTTFYVLDKSLQPVPVGIPGELYIGGDGVARGYVNRPELTEVKFVKSPFRDNERLYKTGDLVRWLPDGNIEFIGRIDHQVKIRGFRIELEEIQVVLEQHPVVRDAVVTAYDDVGGKRIAAYVVTQGEQNAEQLRVYLKSKLPDFMVPSAFVFLDALPLTPNGKVDRRALPAPDVKQLVAKKPGLPPRNSLENQLAKIWETVLGCKPIGVRDNFFELGGHSLLAVRLFAQIEKTMGQKMPLSTLFQAPTIEQLARIISKKSWSAPGASLVEIQSNGSRPPMFWLHTLGGGGGGGLFTYRKLAELLGPDQPSYGLVAAADPFTRIEAMAAHYINELRTIQPSGPYHIGGYCFGGVIAFEMARQLAEQGAKVGLLALIESVPPNVPESNLERFAHLIKTVPAWVAYTAGIGPSGMVKRLGNKIANTARRIRRRSSDQSSPSVQEQINEVIDFSHYPEDYKRYAEAHWTALSQYRPKVFDGRITLFRTPRPRLLALDAEKIWAKLTTRGVDLRIVPGTHENVLEEPYVGTLAQEMRRCFVAKPVSPISLQTAAQAA